MAIDEKNGSSRLFLTHRLPDPERQRRAAQLFLPQSVGDFAARYPLAVTRARHARIPVCRGGLRGALLLDGPPGTGKTTLAEGIADNFARFAFSRDGKHTTLYDWQIAHFFSEYLGQSPKAIDEAFRVIEFATRHDSWAVVLINEVEAFAADRASLGRGDPSDVQRAVNTILTGLDRAGDSSRVLWLFTTNFAKSVDAAFLDRCDYVLTLPYPDASAARDILRDTVEALGPVAAVADTFIDEVVHKLYGNCEPAKLSGRDLRRLMSLSFIEAGESTITPEQVLRVADGLKKRNGSHGNA